MAKKKLRSGLQLDGIAPNILLKHVEVTAPFIFKGELKSDSPETAYIEKLRFYKKNLKALSHIDLSEYFHICMASHWSTAGTFVPTNVDNLIREKLWKHPSIKKHIKKMARITVDSWNWNYEQVTNRKSYNRKNKQVISTHEGTWLSVAIGAYCALKEHGENELSQEIEDLILKEIQKEQDLLIQLREDRDHINFLRAAPLMAHNFGDLDRVMVQWNMHQEDSFCKKVYKLGHILSEDYSPILVYTGYVNKRFSSKENHRHMSMRQPKCLRKSYKFLIPVGPFMDHWGQSLSESIALSLEEKAQIIASLYEGHKRQDQAFGYIRCFKELLKAFPAGPKGLENYLAYDLLEEIQDSPFSKLAQITREEFEMGYINDLESFICPVTDIKF